MSDQTATLSTERLVLERAKLAKYARAYKGPQQALVSKYLEALNGQ